MENKYSSIIKKDINTFDNIIEDEDSELTKRIAQSNNNLFHIKTENTKKSLFDRIPNVILENDIFSYLNSKELFFSIRPVNTEWSDMMKNLWCNKIKDELVEQVKSIDFIYEKEVISKTYEFKVEYLINYRNLLSIYHSSTNILSIISELFADNTQEEELIRLLKLYFEYFMIDELKPILEEKRVDDFKDYINTQENADFYKSKFTHLIQIESFHWFGEGKILEFKQIFNTINKHIIEDISEHAKLIYSLLQGLIEYEILKHDIKQLRIRQKALISKIQYITNEWPKKKKFFERAYRLMLYSK